MSGFMSDRAKKNLAITEIDWRTRAACRGNTARFFVELFEPLACATCAGCPVRVECQQDGLQEPYGVFGGLTPAERRRVQEKRKRARVGADA